jgi:hypothetical protein
MFQGTHQALVLVFFFPQQQQDVLKHYKHQPGLLFQLRHFHFYQAF